MRALLNIASVPPAWMPRGDLALRVGTTSDEVKALFATEDEWQLANRIVHLWRLSRDLIGAKEKIAGGGGWKQSDGKGSLEGMIVS